MKMTEGTFPFDVRNVKALIKMIFKNIYVMSHGDF